ncbi:MAG: RNA methyltransferase [Flavobacteriales bacterium]|nr:RNA methyltransferase [Flavobacteriales bacterium]
MRKLQNKELGRLDADQFRKADKLPLTIVLDNIRSAHNVGSVFRSADAFRVAAIYCCGITAVPPQKELLKTALGATDTVTWKYFGTTGEAIHELKQYSTRIIGIEQTDISTSLNDFRIDPTTSYAIVLGHEVKGVSADILSLCDAVVDIPQAGTKHSLNIAVAAGIVSWAFFRQHSLVSEQTR